MSELKTNCNNKCPFYSTTTCLKPEAFVCPDTSIGVSQVPHNENEELWGVTTVKEDSISYLTKRCAICGNDIKFIENSSEIVCNKCKEAIKKLKLFLGII